MNPQTTNSTNDPNQLTSEVLIHIEGGAFYVDIPNVIAKNKLLYATNIYELLQYDSNKTPIVRTTKFWHASYKGGYITLVLLDLNSGEILKPRQRVWDSMPCSWFILSSEVFTPKSKEQEAQEYCENN